MNSAIDNNTWFRACMAHDVPENGGVCVKYHDHQIALFYFKHRNEWYATQNMCPHRRQMAISRGMLGSHNDEPKIACPFHKRTFSLVDGRCLNSDDCHPIRTYEVKVKEGVVYINISLLTAQDNNHTNTNTHAKITH